VTEVVANDTGCQVKKSIRSERENGRKESARSVLVRKSWIEKSLSERDSPAQGLRGSLYEAIMSENYTHSP
jgi:hypothetical protein